MVATSIDINRIAQVDRNILLTALFMVTKTLNCKVSTVHVNSLKQTGSLLEYGKQPNYTMHVNVASGVSIIDFSCLLDFS